MRGRARRRWWSRGRGEAEEDSGSLFYDGYHHPYPAYRDAGTGGGSHYYPPGQAHSGYYYVPSRGGSRRGTGFHYGDRSSPGGDDDDDSNSVGAYMSGHGVVECCPLVVKPLVLVALLGTLAAAVAFLNVLITMNIGRRRRRRRRRRRKRRRRGLKGGGDFSLSGISGIWLGM